jgi:hypothetical protein
MGSGWFFHKREALSTPRGGVWRMQWDLMPVFLGESSGATESAMVVPLRSAVSVDLNRR